jgi:hypothetical protein
MITLAMPKWMAWLLRRLVIVTSLGAGTHLVLDVVTAFKEADVVEHMDIFTGDLTRHLEVLDAEISAMSDDNSRSNAAITDGCFDRIEYFLGAGLAAVQKYISETICSSDEDQLKALALRSSVYDA